MTQHHLPSTNRLLGDWLARAAAAGLTADPLDSAAPPSAIVDATDLTVSRTPPLTVDRLLALDAQPEAAPRWLREAHTEAVAELAAWHTPAERHLPTPEEPDDPGEPSPDEARCVYPRPVAETAQRRLIEYLKCRASPVYFLDSYAMVFGKDDGGKIIPLRLWRWQAWLLYQWLAHPRNIVLKGRQLGLSELALGLAVWLILFHPSKVVFFISIGESEANELLVRARTIMEHLPDWLKPGDLDHPAPSRIGKANESVFQIIHHSARGAKYPSRITSLPSRSSAGRSLVASLLVLDEWAAQLFAEEIWLGVKDAAGGGGTLIGLSTAHGVGNLFANMWDYATSPEGQGDFFSVFLSWRRHPRRDDAWYERERAEKVALNQEHLLHQEHPTTALSAFTQSANNVFDLTYLARHEARINDEIRQRAADGAPNGGRFETADGLTIYEPPLADHAYVLAADVAEGKDNGDYDAAVVLERESGRQVAELRGHWDVDVYAGYLDQLGHYYNLALLVPERNNHGHAVLLALRTGLAHERWAGERLPYPRLYHRNNPLLPGQRDDRAPGFVTDARSKPLVVDTLATWLREDLTFPRSVEFLREAKIFARSENGAMGAPAGRHDDLVMAYAIAVYALSQPRGPEEKLAQLAHARDLVAGRLAAHNHSAEPPAGGHTQETARAALRP